MKFSTTSPGFALLLCTFTLYGCVTMGPSYEPASYGIEALKAVIANPSSSVVDAVAATEELAQRNLSKSDEEDLGRLLMNNRDPSVSMALLQLIEDKKMSHLRDDLLQFRTSVLDSDTAVKLQYVAIEFLDQQEKAEYLAESLLESNHARVRAVSAGLLADGDHPDPEAVLIEALVDEKNAVVAKEICLALLKVGSENAMPILTELSNNTTRPFREDNVMGEKVTAVDVRIAAIQAAETLSAIFGD